MNCRSYLLVAAVCLLGGCTSSRSVLCVAPAGEFKPQSEAELLAELNSHLPFTIDQRHFVSKEKSNGLVGWALVQNDEQKDTVKNEIEKSSTLKLLQVEPLTLEFEAVLKQRSQKDKRAVTPDESLSDSTLHLIRNAAINNIGQLSNEEQRTILETTPQVGRYKLAGEFKQYKLRWDLPTGRSVLVSFTGFIENIDENDLQIALVGSP